MEEIETEFLLEFPEIPETKFVAVFDPDTGRIVSVGPDFAFENTENKIEIDAILAESIITGETVIHDCFVDFYDYKVEIKQAVSLYKIDDVLHRISDKQYVEFVDADVYVVYNKDKSEISIELTERFCGTRSITENTDFRKQKMIWNGDTELVFYVTAYNDPHIIYETVILTVSDLIEKNFKVPVKVPAKFSIFTRRLFKRYVMETV
jgi:hypothetical protein